MVDELEAPILIVMTKGIETKLINTWSYYSKDREKSITRTSDGDRR